MAAASVVYTGHRPGMKTRLFKRASELKSETMRTKTVQEQRQMLTRFQEMRPIPPGVTVEQRQVAGVPCEWITTSRSRRDRVLLYIHGGSWCFGNLESARPTGVLLSEFCDYSVLVVEYRLAPEHPFPAGLLDCHAVYTALLDAGVPAECIGIFGDSAGGNLSLCLQHMLIRQGRPLPAAVGCASPVTDVTESSSFYRHQPDLLYTVYEDRERNIFELYRGALDATSPVISPVYGDLHSFPPTLLHVGEDEALCEDNVAFATAAAGQGAPVICKVWRELFHDFTIVGITIRESRLSLREFAAHFRMHMG